VRGFYSPIDKLAADIPRTKGTGAEFMTELSKRPGYKPAEAEDRNLQTLMALPKMERAQFLQALKAKPAPSLEESERVERPQDPDDARTKYEEYTIPGGENYREILLSMPHDPNRKQSPSSNHWDSPDVLAHVRAKDRTGPNGEKILHIEEVQSDWHQAGREKGYRSPDAKAARNMLLRERALAAARLENHKREMAVTDAYLASDAPLWQQPEAKARLKARQAEQNKVLMDLLPKAMRADTEYQKALKAEHDTVPDAPFKKNWHELALKKMIHHAAANGYDSIAITPGAEQAKRYGLSKHVGRITHMTHHDDPDSGILFAFDPSGRQIVEKHNIPHAELPEYIGKEGTQKLLGQKPDENGYRELSGQNLEVGGEGMKGFYDKMIPSFLNQFGKKYGAKVGTTSITPGMTAGEVFDKHYGEVRRAIRNGDFGGQQFIAEKMAEINKPVAAHTFPITPEMREDVVKNGVPLYADGGKVKGGKVESKAEFLKSSKVKDVLYRGGIGHPNMSEDFLKGKARPGYATFASTSPHVAGSYAHPDQDENVVGAIAPMHIKAHTLHEFPVETDKRGFRKFSKTAFDRHAQQLQPGHALVARQVYDYGPRASLKTDPDKLYSYPSDIYAWNEGTETKSALSKAKGGKVKPIGYTKEKVTVAPNLDAMKYELMSVKHFAKKAK